MILSKCYKLGICSILVEAGGTLFTSMYNNKLIDELHLFISPKKIGRTGIPMYRNKNNLLFKKLNPLLVKKKKFNKDLYYQYNM